MMVFRFPGRPPAKAYYHLPSIGDVYVLSFCVGRHRELLYSRPVHEMWDRTVVMQGVDDAGVKSIDVYQVSLPLGETQEET